MKNKKMIVVAIAATLITSVAMAAPVFYPSAPEQPRIQFLKAINGANFFGAANPYGNRFPNYKGPQVADSDPIYKPYGIALAGGKIYICDSAAPAVKIFNLDKKFVTSLGVDAPGKLSQPLNIAVSADGMKYVVDGSLRQIMVYDANNLFVKAYGDSKTLQPTDVVLFQDKLYVTDLTSSQVVVMDAGNGAELSRISQSGAGKTDLFKPTNLTVDKDGNLYVSDTINARVQVFSVDGKFVRSIGTRGDQLGDLARPKGVAVDRENRLYVVDSAFENVQIFNKENKLLLPFGSAGNVDGGMNMPAKVVIDYDHAKYFAQDVAPGYKLDYVILVSNQFGSGLVNVYGFLSK